MRTLAGWPRTIVHVLQITFRVYGTTPRASKGCTRQTRLRVERNSLASFETVPYELAAGTDPLRSASTGTPGKPYTISACDTTPCNVRSLELKCCCNMDAFSFKYISVSPQGLLRSLCYQFGVPNTRASVEKRTRGVPQRPSQKRAAIGEREPKC